MNDDPAVPEPSPWAAPDQESGGSSAPPAPKPAPGTGFPPPGAFQGAPASPGRDGYAVTSLIFGLIGGVLPSVAFGIVALVRIRRNGGEGRGLAIAGMVLSGAWALLLTIGALTLLPEIEKGFDQANGGSSGDPTAERDSTSGLFPSPGECFNGASDNPAAVTEVPCDRPHEAQMILTFRLPSGSWPGGREVEKRSLRGCEQRLDAWSKHREGLDRLSAYALFPSRVTWWSGDRTVRCALTGEGEPIRTIDMSTPSAALRTWSELKPKDCISFPHPKAVQNVTIAGCRAPHTAQVTHVFTFEDGAWSGESAAEERANAGCTRRWDALFAGRRPVVPLDRWYMSPREDDWARGDRSVICYVTAKKGELDRPVL